MSPAPGGNEQDMQLPDLSLLLVMVVFWATFWVLRVSLFRPVGRLLDEREKTLARAERELEAALVKEREALADIDARLTAARQESMAAREKLRQAAAARRHAALERAREDARATVAAAQERLEADIATARGDLKTSVEAMAREIASATLGRKVA